MENQMIIFRNPAFGEVRSFIDENKVPWFVGREVATILGYKDASKAICDHVEDEDKTTLLIQQSGSNYKSRTTFINESGLFSLAISSKLPQAKAFRHWVTSEVLPSIRRHGVYMTDQALERALTDPDYLIRLATTIKEERALRLAAEAQCNEQTKLISELDRQVSCLQQSVNEMQEKVSYLDLILASKTCLNTTQIAQDYGMSARKFNSLMHNLRIQYKVNDQWILYADFKDKGYVTSQTIQIAPPNAAPFIKVNTVWTPEGRMFIYYKLKENGILPTIERNNSN